jgi:YcxB-like protein
MKETITVRFRWTAEELIAATRAHLRSHYSLHKRICFWLCGPLMFLGGLSAVISSRPNLMGLFALVVGATLLLFFPLILPRMLRRQFAQRPDRDSEVEWRINDENLAARGIHGNSEFTWSALSKVVQTKRGFLLYPTPQIFHWLPRHGFSNDTDFENLSQLARQHASKFIQKS